jgi:pyruvate dehydrogenase E2 component (dihydrolipoamide acetyltransferase)
MRRAAKPTLWWVVVPGLVATAVFLDRPRTGRPAHQAEWLAAGDSRVRVVRAGAGDTTLLLLHGFGESLFSWRAVVDALAVRNRVIAIDLPGFGGSEKPDASYSLPALTDRLAAFADAWTRGPLVLVGHSMGGALAAALALERPSRVIATVLIAPAGWDVGLAGIADTMYPAKARAIGWYLSSRAFLLPEHDPDWLAEPDSAARYTLMGDDAYRNSAARVLQEFDFRGLRDRFTNVAQPTLLIWGTLDPVIPYALADSVAAQLPCRRLVSLPNALHRPQVEVPDTVVAEIDRFLRDPACDR